MWAVAHTRTWHSASLSVPAIVAVAVVAGLSFLPPTVGVLIAPPPGVQRSSPCAIRALWEGRSILDPAGVWQCHSSLGLTVVPVKGGSVLLQLQCCGLVGLGPLA